MTQIVVRHVDCGIGNLLINVAGDSIEHFCCVPMVASWLCHRDGGLLSKMLCFASCLRNEFLPPPLRTFAWKLFMCQA